MIDLLRQFSFINLFNLLLSLPNEHNVIVAIYFPCQPSLNQTLVITIFLHLK